MLKETKDTQGINSGGSSNDNMASDFSTNQTHAIKDGSIVISKVVSGVLCYMDSLTALYRIINIVATQGLLVF